MTASGTASRRVVVLGAGIGGLAAAALLASAGHRVTIIEGNEWIGGKSRRIEVDGQRIDTGPSLVTFPAVWEELLRRCDDLGRSPVLDAATISNLALTRLPEVGRYFFDGTSTTLPVEEGHPWHEAWVRFERVHGGFGPQITAMLTAHPLDPKALPAALTLFRTYGTRLTARRFLDGLAWMPHGLREVIAIHSLNAGVSPARSLALYASMPAVMARDGVWVPEGGVYEVPLALHRLARHAGAEVRTGERVISVTEGAVRTVSAEYRADVVVSGLDAQVLEDLLPDAQPPSRRALTCSGVAIYAVLERNLPAPTATHSVVMPDDPAALHRSLAMGAVPEQTMAFVNYFRPNEVYPNERPTVALLLTAPADGRGYDLDDPFIEREIGRISRAIGISDPMTEWFRACKVFDPRYFAASGAAGGALYGATRPLWQSGPLHRPSYHDRRRPWLWRVGASVHPGGGIPAVLGGAMVSMDKLLRQLAVR